MIDWNDDVRSMPNSVNCLAYNKIDDDIIVGYRYGDIFFTDDQDHRIGLKYITHWANINKPT